MNKSVRKKSSLNLQLRMPKKGLNLFNTFQYMLKYIEHTKYIAYVTQVASFYLKSETFTAKKLYLCIC